MQWKRTFLRAALAGLLCLGLLSSGAGAAEVADEPERAVLGIYTTGSMHGKFFAQDPVTGSTVEDGYLKVASAMAEERQSVTASLLLDSGNALNGGLVSGWDLRQETDPVALALRTIGYDALVPSLGEFQAMPEYRDMVFAQLTVAEPGSEQSEPLEQEEPEEEEGTEEPGGEVMAGEETAVQVPGTPVALLSANYLDEETEEPLLEPYRIFTVELEGSAYQIGVAGLGAVDALEWLPAEYCEGARFAHTDNRAGSYAWEWNERLWPALLDCDLTVVVCDCGELAEFVAETSGIDLVVSSRGEADVWYFTDASGVRVPCVSGGGTALTRTLVSTDGEGGLTVERCSLLELDEYPNDPALAQDLSEAALAAGMLAGQRVGLLAGEWDSGEGIPYVQTDAADLTARAMLWASGADGALLAPGSLEMRSLRGLFWDESLTAVLTLRGCYSIYPYPYSMLCLVELTGEQLRDWLDVCAGRYTVDESGYLSGGEDADMLYGLDYELYVGNNAGSRVENLTWQGEPVQAGQRFRVAVDSRRLEDPEFPDAAVLWRASSDHRFAAQGGSIPAVLAAYCSDVSLVVPQRESAWTLYAGSSGGPMNRLDFVIMLYELAGRPKPVVDAAFVDLSGDPAAVWAAECGIVSGDGQGRFLPTQVVTREQAAVILYRFALLNGLDGVPAGDASFLLDYDQVSLWARAAVDFCYGNGVITCDWDFRPQDAFTRQEAEDFLAVLDDLLNS